MDRMMTRLRGQARSWSGGRGPVEVLEYPAASLRHWLVVPRPCALLAAGQVTAVGVFGDPPRGVDHGPIYQLEAEVVGRFGRYAAAGLPGHYHAALGRRVDRHLVVVGAP